MSITGLGLLIDEASQIKPGLRSMRRPRRLANRVIASLGGISFLRMGISLQMLGYAPLQGFAGFSLRGALGDACALADGRHPQDPPLPGGLFSRVFLPAPSLPGTNAEPPPPFLVIPPPRPLGGLQAGELLDFDLLLFGAAAEAALELPLAFQRLGMRRGITGRHVPFEVRSATLRTPRGEVSLWGPERRRLIDGIREEWYQRGDELALGHGLNGTARSHTHVQLNFKVPFSIRGRERSRFGLPRHVKMEQIIGSIWRGADAYGRHYGEGGCALPLEGLIARSRRVVLEDQRVRRVRLGRRSYRNGEPGGKSLEINCYVGSLSYGGSLSSLIPLLTLGETLGVGRSRCMGLGRYGMRPS